MSKFAIGEKVDNAADDHEVGTVIAVFRQLTAALGTPLTQRVRRAPVFHRGKLVVDH